MLLAYKVKAKPGSFGSFLCSDFLRAFEAEKYVSVRTEHCRSALRFEVNLLRRRSHTWSSPFLRAGSHLRANSRIRCSSCTTTSSTRRRARPRSATSTLSCSRSSKAKEPKPSLPKWPSRCGAFRSRSATSSARRSSNLQRCVRSPAPRVGPNAGPLHSGL